MKYKIGDVLLIKSKIHPNPSDVDGKKEVRVCTSCNNGWDRFRAGNLVIEDGYVIHEVVVKDFCVYPNGRKTYRCTNNLSVSGVGWQGVADCDVIKKVRSSRLKRKPKAEENNMAKKVIDGIEVNGKSILTALKIIKQVCEDNETNCEDCPFYVNNRCGIGDTDPADWKILEYEKWRALG